MAAAADTGAQSLSAAPSLAYYEPRIPENTGAAIRLSAVTGAHLHLIEPLGFDLSEPKLKRAGLDYHDLATVTVHASFEAFLAAVPHARVFAYTAKADTVYSDIEYRPDDILLFGPEPTGLPEEAMAHPRITDRVRIPMLPGRRSLNLTNAASLVVYEAWRQSSFAATLDTP
ncbi:tRNA (cytidine(34)-2'-O)-methyltransferase [Demequina aurantiaca]|uniref:tRNA (cytidine(34)-2'-O)-methyltransferase n=1 Tax=Demequina aurantiaca TaxID=676200 RepID=UPI0007851409|nr:tRNA (cytidine(34)-2'-O)-methyltransferase [Demequina aurantiaca]